VSSVGGVGRRKPRAVDRLRKASRQSLSAESHHAGDGYENLASTVAWLYVERLSAGHGVEEYAEQTVTAYRIQEVGYWLMLCTTC